MDKERKSECKKEKCLIVFLFLKNSLASCYGTLSSHDFSNPHFVFSRPTNSKKKKKITVGVALREMGGGVVE